MPQDWANLAAIVPEPALLAAAAPLVILVRLRRPRRGVRAAMLPPNNAMYNSMTQ
jgi:hypothetical protein